jgi:hypothetical protein
MSIPTPERMLRHRPPALLVDAVLSYTGTSITCSARGEGPWTWPRLLEGAAQTAGLLAGLQPDGLTNMAVIAEYRGVLVHAQESDGPVRFTAEVERRLMRFWRCRLAVYAGDALLLEGSVTLAPPSDVTQSS